MAGPSTNTATSWGDDLSEELDTGNTDTTRLLEPQNFRQTQERLLAAQDQGLDRLTEAVKRQKMMAHGIATEVDIHNDILDEIDEDIDQSVIKSTRKQAYDANIFEPALKFSFENRHIWFQFGLTLSLSKKCPRRALQVFRECMRIDAVDPMPAMLAAKLVIEDLSEPEEALELSLEAIKRCETIKADNEKKIQTEDTNGINKTTTTIKYKNIEHILSKCYLLTSIMNACIYELEPESIRKLKLNNIKNSFHYLDLALNSNPNDYLTNFHKALHEAHKRSIKSAIDYTRRALKINPQHVPSIRLLLLCLSALKLNSEALALCQSALQEFQEDLSLLYIKCNLEQILEENKGYYSALNTAKHILKCIRRINMKHTEGSKPEEVITNIQQNSQITSIFAHTSGDFSEEYTKELNIWLLIAEIFIKMGLINDAESCVMECLNQVNGALSYHIMFVKGLIYRAKGNYHEAKSYFQSVIAIYPRHAKALQQLAHMYYLLGNQSTAEKFLKDSLDVDNSLHETWYYMSLVLLEVGQATKASDCVMKAIKLESTSPVIPFSSISRIVLD